MASPLFNPKVQGFREAILDITHVCLLLVLEAMAVTGIQPFIRWLVFKDFAKLRALHSYSIMTGLLADAVILQLSLISSLGIQRVFLSIFVFVQNLSIILKAWYLLERTDNLMRTKGNKGAINKTFIFSVVVLILGLLLSELFAQIVQAHPFWSTVLCTPLVWQLCYQAFCISKPKAFHKDIHFALATPALLASLFVATEEWLAGLFTVAGIAFLLKVFRIQADRGADFFLPACWKSSFDYRIVQREEVDCGICLRVMFRGEEAWLTPCGHRFHGDCLLPWMDIKMSCPYCKGDLPSHTL